MSSLIAEKRGKTSMETDRQTDRQTDHSFFFAQLQELSRAISDNAYNLMEHFDSHIADDPSWLAACRARDLSIQLHRCIEQMEKTQTK